MSDDFKARDVQFFTNFRKVKFKSYNVKNCRLSQDEMIKIIETYRYRPFNDRIAYLEVYTSNKIEGNTLTKGQTKAVLEGIAQDADLRSQTEVIQLNRAIRDNFSINNEAIDRFNNSDKELIDIFKFKLDFVRVHPFMDGNGRLSRLIMNGLLTAKSYPRIIIRNQDKGFYYDAIEDSLKVGKYDAWLKFMLTYMKFMCELEDTFLLDIE